MQPKNTLSSNSRMITIVGKSQVKLEVSKIVAIIDADKDSENYQEVDIFVNKALQEGRFQPLLTDKSKIKSYILTENNIVFPSSVKIKTLADRIENKE